MVGAAHAQMNKCVTASGKVEYRDTPCEQSSQGRSLSGGTVSGVQPLSQQEMQRARTLIEAEKRAQPAPAQIIGGTKPGRPTAQDIRDLETSASSTTLGKKERDFLQSELKRAKAAAAGEGSYTDKDLANLKERQADQNRISDADREAARRQAESTHLKAGGRSQSEGILQERQAQEDRANARRAAAARQAQEQEARKHPDRDRLQQCNFGNCTSSSGATYREHPAGGFERREDGARCRRSPAGTGAIDC